MNLIEQILTGQGSNAATTIKSALGKKVLEAVTEERKRVVAEVYGEVEETVTPQPFDKNRVQGIPYNHDTEHANHPFHSTLAKHGFTYSHTGGQGEHIYKHSNPKHPVSHVMIRKNPYQDNKPMYSATNSKSQGGATKQGHEPEKLNAHLTKMAAKQKKLGESVEMISEAVPYPEKSKHLKDYKVVTPKDDPNYDKEWRLEHPEGHTLIWNRQNNTFTHHAAGVAKPKTGRMVDLHPHLMKVHNKFDDQVKDYVSRYHGGASEQIRLQHLMGALEYRMKKPDYDGDREADAIRYKAMHAALMKLSKSDRGVR